MKSSNPSHRFLLTEVEPLENRRLLAGNVTATITASGNLVINGDSENNEITVQLELGGGVSVNGQAGTTIDDSGLAGSSISGDVVINLRGGNDRVELYGLDYSNIAGLERINISGGSGHDWLEVHTLDYPGHNSQLNGGSGDDTLRINDVRGIGRFKMIGGSGHDDIVVANSDLASSNPDNAAGELFVQGGSGDDLLDVDFLDAEKMTVNLAGGDDDLEIERSSVTGNVSIVGGTGDDNFQFYDVGTGDLQINSGAGNDDIGLDQFYTKYGDSAAISSGTGNDTIQMRDVIVASELDVNSAGGDDLVVLAQIESPSIDVRTGGGGDHVIVMDSDVGESIFVMGGGDDVLIWSSSVGFGTANGGGGANDVLEVYECFNPLDDTGFESSTLFEPVFC